MSDEDYAAYVKKLAVNSLATKEKYWDLLKISEGISWYEKVEVPEGFTGNEEEEEKAPVDENATKEEQAKAVVFRQSATERRKLEGKTIIHQMNPTSTSVSIPGTVSQSLKMIYEFSKKELPFTDIDRWDAEEIYYGFEEDRELMIFTGLLTRDPHPLNNPEHGYIRGHAINDKGYGDLGKFTSLKWWRKNKNRFQHPESIAEQWEVYAYQHFYDTKVMIFKIAKSTERYYRQFARIQEFYITIRDKTITMSNTLVKWNTARLILQRLGSLNFLYNFSQFNYGYWEKYHKLVAYVNANFRQVEGYNSTSGYNIKPETYRDMIEHLDNVHKFQDLVKDNTDKREIARVAKELFGNSELKDGMAYEPEMMNMLHECLEYYAAAGEMLNYIPVLTGIPAGRAVREYIVGMIRLSNTEMKITEELEGEIRNYLEFKGIGQVKAISEPELVPSSADES